MNLKKLFCFCFFVFCFFNPPEKAFARLRDDLYVNFLHAEFPDSPPDTLVKGLFFLFLFFFFYPQIFSFISIFLWFCLLFSSPTQTTKCYKI